MAHFKYLDLEFSEVFIFDNFLVSQMREGYHIGYAHVEKLKVIVENYFGDRDLVYLSNRVNSYSVYPLIYKELADIENIKGVGVITKKDTTLKNAAFEKEFYRKAFNTFGSLEEACIWVYSLIDKKQNN